MNIFIRHLLALNYSNTLIKQKSVSSESNLCKYPNNDLNNKSVQGNSTGLQKKYY